MNRKPNIELPPELEVYRQQIEATIKPYVEIQLTENSNPTWWQSKFGGLPYLPKGFEYPKSNTGDYLYLLAQINFAEVPALAPLPRQGILQFYIASDGLYGLNFKNPTKQDTFRVVYFHNANLPEADLTTNFNFLLPENNRNLPFKGCSKVEFLVSHAPMSFEDYQFYVFGYSDVSNDAFDEYYEKSKASGHKLLGYPFFTQEDPRVNFRKNESYILLLQIDTDDNNCGFDILWGDLGIGNFFIKQSALVNLDFSNVIYNWDCA